MRQRLREAQARQAEVAEEERATQQREAMVENESKDLALEHERLQEGLDKYCIERERFEREAMKVKEQAERD